MKKKILLEKLLTLLQILYIYHCLLRRANIRFSPCLGVTRERWSN
jgi:hypothetical protein